MEKWYKTFLPYALKLLEDGSIVVLNRFYKPLGFDKDKSGWIEYESLPMAFETRIGWARVAARLGYELQAETADLIFLYSDSIPLLNRHGRLIYKNWNTYIRKLEKLASIKLARPRR
jgi:hypothetical protein